MAELSAEHERVMERDRTMLTDGQLLTHRVEYVKHENDEDVSVIYEVYADGREVFSQSAFSEVTTYKFEPSPLERRKARKLLAEEGQPSSEEGGPRDARCPNNHLQLQLLFLFRGGPAPPAPIAPMWTTTAPFN